jgi:hypothetical protein
MHSLVNLILIGHIQMEDIMNSKNRRMQYLDISRLQLRRETDAMGYGIRISSGSSIYESNIVVRPRSVQIIPDLLATLGLISKQIQPSS